MTVKEWIDMFNRKQENIAKAYNYRFRNLPVNQAGEVDAEELLKLQAWGRSETERIANLMVNIFPKCDVE